MQLCLWSGVYVFVCVAHQSLYVFGMKTYVIWWKNAVKHGRGGMAEEMLLDLHQVDVLLVDIKQFWFSPENEKKKTQSYKSEQMLLVVLSWPLLFCWEVCGRRHFASGCCVWRCAKTTGSVLSQTCSVDVQMDCFSSCLLRFFFLIVISYSSVTFKSAHTQTQWATMSSRSFFTDLCQCCGLRSTGELTTGERRNWGQRMATGPVQ